MVDKGSGPRCPLPESLGVLTWLRGGCPEAKCGASSVCLVKAPSARE